MVTGFIGPLCVVYEDLAAVPNQFVPLSPLPGLMSDPRAIKVVLRGPDGRYVAGHQGAWIFTEDRAQARVFDYLADRIAEQLELLHKNQGIIWTVVPVDPRERYEICDHCGHRVMTFKVFFDGRQYLCPDCRIKTVDSNRPLPESCPSVATHETTGTGHLIKSLQPDPKGPLC
ncbi:MAG TPA: hypothetical protein VNT26_19710 [Candidatus Sulfotelmatobacter sp.]|nr:hypothetical protein [Candidatus Sulfotelmatobacter sp.]